MMSAGCLQLSGDLSVSEDRLSEKRNGNDFALWKSSKPGERHGIRRGERQDLCKICSSCVIKQANCI